MNSCNICICGIFSTTMLLTERIYRLFYYVFGLAEIVKTETNACFTGKCHMGLGDNAYINYLCKISIQSLTLSFILIILVSFLVLKRGRAGVKCSTRTLK